MGAAGQVALPSYVRPVAAPTASPGPAGHERPIVGGGVYAPATTYPPDTGGGFAGTTDQSATAASLAGMKNDSPEWVAAQGSANANAGVLPGVPHTAVQSSPFDSDPGVADATAREQLGLPSIDNGLQNLIAQRIVAYGDPSLAAQAGFGLDPQAAAFARQNYLSGNGQLARLDKSHEQARRAIINQLAAHGILFSGELGYGTGQADQSYGNQVYDAQQQALADILGYRNNAQSQRDALRNARVAALEHAYDYGVDHPGLYATVGSSGDTGSGTGYVIPNRSGSPGDRDGMATPSSFGATQPRQAVLKQLTNPYTTGRKRRG